VFWGSSNLKLKISAVLTPGSRQIPDGKVSGQAGTPQQPSVALFCAQVHFHALDSRNQQTHAL